VWEIRKYPNLRTASDKVLLQIKTSLKTVMVGKRNFAPIKLFLIAIMTDYFCYVYFKPEYIQ